ncbi:hypothetical protein [Dictyobacter formicarum]|uniref:hypothetical protein n=1 Tax=Dictyobacter formicarum TaxID=2778368 RepID=UPI0019165C8C|nr:hypothetical protein [Dictyobacter formicarum]
MARYEELVALRLMDHAHLRERLCSLGSRLYRFSGTELRPAEITRWRTLRKELDDRHEARRQQYRFRKAPERYLQALTEQLLKLNLPT